MRFSDRARIVPRLAVVSVCALLAGCSTNLRHYSGSLGAMGQSTSGARAPMETLASRYDAKPGEKRASMDYAAALRASGQHPQAVAVLQRASVTNIGDREVAAAYGKALADTGRFEEALNVLAQAHTEDQPNWQVFSTMGSVSDQMGNHTRAREHYHRALQIAPRQPGVLNNLGLSYILTKDLARAEEVLAEAAAQPGADPRVSANLALARSLRAQDAKGQGNQRAPNTQKSIGTPNRQNVPADKDSAPRMLPPLRTG